jgi:hypothetical protein
MEELEEGVPVRSELLEQMTRDPASATSQLKWLISITAMIVRS